MTNQAPLYCAQCGAKLVEGEAHHCNESYTVNAGKTGLDPSVIIQLLKRPMSSLNLNAQKEWLYGLIGIAASILGFTIWGLSFAKQVFKSVFGGIGMFSHMILPYKNSFSIALLSMAVFMVALWGAGVVFGRKKLAFMEVLTKIGALQFIFGVVFLIAGILCFISTQVAAFLVVLTLLVTLVASVIAAVQIFQVENDKLVWMVSVFAAGYLLLTTFLGSLFL